MGNALLAPSTLQVGLAGRPRHQAQRGGLRAPWPRASGWSLRATPDGEAPGAGTQ